MSTFLKLRPLSFCKRLFLYFFMFVFFLSCKKIDSHDIKQVEQSFQLNNIISQSNRESTLTPDNITTWLTTQIDSLVPRKNYIIGKVLADMQIDKKYIESLNEKENLIIIPLIKDYFSQQINIDSLLPLQYLLLVEDSSGRIRRGDIALFYQKKNDATVMPKNSFHNFFNQQSISIDGTFSLITLEDVKQYEMDFKDGKKTQFRLWEGRLALPPNPDDPGGTGQTCLDWYLVITEFNLDGTIAEANAYFLFTSCLGGGSGGGGGSNNNNVPQPDPGIPVTVNTIFIVASSPGFYNIEAGYSITGIRFLNSSRNVINAILPCGISYANNIGPAGDPGSPWNCIWTEFTNSSGVNAPLSAWAHVTGKTELPHQQLMSPIDRLTTFFASIVLH